MLQCTEMKCYKVLIVSLCYYNLISCVIKNSKKIETLYPCSASRNFFWFPLHSIYLEFQAQGFGLSILDYQRRKCLTRSLTAESLKEKDKFVSPK